MVVGYDYGFNTHLSLLRDVTVGFVTSQNKSIISGRIGNRARVIQEYFLIRDLVMYYLCDQMYGVLYCTINTTHTRSIPWMFGMTYDRLRVQTASTD